MKIMQGNMLTSLENVKTFLSEHAAEIGDPVTDSTQKEIDDCIVELGEHVAVQNTRTRVAASTLARQRAKREALVRDHLAPIAKIAKLRLAHIPEMVSFTLLGLLLDYALGTVPGMTIGLTLLGLAVAFFHLVQMSKAHSSGDAAQK